MWKSWFSSTILSRGEDYFEAGAVKIESMESDSIVAIVFGNRKYDVGIEFNGGQISEMYCTCPYAEDEDYCKHMVAVMLEAESQGFKPGNKTGPSLHEQVMAADGQLVRNFLIEALTGNYKLKKRFLAAVDKASFQKTKAMDGESYFATCQKELDRLLGAIEEETEEEDYEYWEDDYCEAVSDAFDALEEFLNDAVQTFESLGAFLKALELLQNLYLELGDMQKEWVESYFEEAAHVIEDLWWHLLNRQPTLKLGMFEWCEKHLAHDWAGTISLLLRSAFEETEYQKPLLALAEKMATSLKQGDSRNREANFWAKFYLSLLLKNGIDFHDFKAVAEMFWNLSDVRKFYVKHCQEQGHLEEAIDALKKAIKLEEEARYRRDASSMKEQLKDLYKEVGATDAYQTELMEIVKNGKLEIFYELKASLPTEEWKKRREEIFQSIQPGALCDIYQAEQLYHRLYLLAKQLGILSQYEAFLRPHYPEELLDWNEEVVKRKAQQVSDRGTYAQIASQMNHMLSYPDGKQRVQGLLNEFRRVYSRRPAMMEELRLGVKVED